MEFELGISGIVEKKSLQLVNVNLKCLLMYLGLSFTHQGIYYLYKGWYLRHFWIILIFYEVIFGVLFAPALSEWKLFNN